MIHQAVKTVSWFEVLVDMSKSKFNTANFSGDLSPSQIKVNKTLFTYEITKVTTFWKFLRLATDFEMAV